MITKTFLRVRINMNRLSLFFFLVVSILVIGCGRKLGRANTPAELRVLCGSSMAMPAQKTSRLFMTNHEVQVVFDLGGSETLLPKVLLGMPADIFICHDPFEQKTKDAGHWAGSVRVGVLQPVLLVRPGNPLNINSVSDLAQRDVKIGIGDPRYSTCGELFHELLDRKGIRSQVMKRVVLQGRTHAEIANGMIVGPLDAVIVWNFIAQLYKDKVQLVPTADEYPKIHVTVIGLRQSSNPYMRDAFLELCRSAKVKTIFAQHGYGSPPK